ncbi:MAG: hypothetical protein E7517_09720 [Ruminococcaceae bacterium]|nr:hypothetical protein [Oscillospiraceae bacterium]
MDTLFPIIFVLCGGYAIFYGVKIIVTGSMGAKEEARLAAFSEKGAKTYKLVNSIFNILGGIVLIGLAILRFLEAKGTIAGLSVYRYIAIGVLVVLAVSLGITWLLCKKME